MQIFLDLDGPILDNRAKYHALHVALLQGTCASPLSSEDYWAQKQDRVSERTILGKLGLRGSLAAERIRWRQSQLEQIEWLQRDQLWPYAEAWLSQMARHADLFLVTLRNLRQHLLEQLRWLSLDHYFRAILSEDANDGTSETKVRLIEPLRTESAGWMIGDTEVDIHAGRQCRLRTIGVTCGIRTRQRLEAAGADFIATDLSPLSLDWLAKT